MSELPSYDAYANVDPSEKALLATLLTYPDEVQKAAKGYDPSIIAKSYRLTLCNEVAQVLEHAMGLLGIEMPLRM